MKLKTKPNGIYYIDAQLPAEDGTLKRTRVSLDTRDKSNADGQLREWIMGTHHKHPSQGGVIAPKGRPAESITSTKRKSSKGELTVAVWLRRCLSDREVWGNIKARKNYVSNVKIIAEQIGEDMLLTEVDTRYVHTLADDLFDKGYAAGTVRKLMGCLSRALERAAEPNVALISEKPAFPSIKVSNKRERVITVDEEAAMIECVRARREAEPTQPWRSFENLLTLLSNTGFRLGEALSCGAANVRKKHWKDHTGERFSGTWLGLPGSVTKNGKPRDVPATDVVIDLLPELQMNQCNGRWFPWDRGDARPLRMLVKIREDMKAKGFNIDDVVLHTFRHTCATRLAEGGMDLIGLRDWLGHSDIKITADRYVHLMNSHIYRGASILDMYGTSGRTEREPQENVVHLTM